MTVTPSVAAPLGVDRLSPEPSPDAALVGATCRGDREAFGLLVRRYERPLRAACFAVLGDWHLAHDAAQDAFLAAYENLSQLKDPASFGAWLLTIARNRASRLHRRRKPSAPLHLHPELPAGATPVAPDTARLFGAIDRLPEHERAVVLLRHVDGHEVAAIARICGRPVGTVTKQLSRAHRRLQTFLDEGKTQ